jgi:hypothetical protein
MHERSPSPISAAEHQARRRRVEAAARRVGFVGEVEYQHAFRRTGGAHYAAGKRIDLDRLVVDAGAFVRDSAGDDFSLEAIIAHERGHQIVCRHERLRRNVPPGMSGITEEVVASLVGALVAPNSRDGETLVLKALADLVDCGIQAAEASRRVEDLLSYLEAIL